jgi:hypothetical protein
MHIASHDRSTLICAVREELKTVEFPSRTVAGSNITSRFSELLPEPFIKG